MISDQTKNGTFRKSLRNYSVIKKEYFTLQKKIYISSSLKAGINTIDIFVMGAFIDPKFAGSWATLKKIFSPSVIIADYIGIIRSNHLYKTFKNSFSIKFNFLKGFLASLLLNFIILTFALLLSEYFTILNVFSEPGIEIMSIFIISVLQFTFSWWTKYFSSFFNPLWSLYMAALTLILTLLIPYFEIYTNITIYLLGIVILRSTFWLWRLFKYEKIAL